MVHGDQGQSDYALVLTSADNITAAPLATAFASSLAWLILKLGEHGPIAPWRLLFLLEGFPAIIVATCWYSFHLTLNPMDCHSRLRTGAF